jgi:hypothetical protein
MKQGEAVTSELKRFPVTWLWLWKNFYPFFGFRKKNSTNYIIVNGPKGSAASPDISGWMTAYYSWGIL